MHFFKPFAAAFRPIALRNAGLVEVGQLRLSNAVQALVAGLQVEDSSSIQSAMMELGYVVPLHSRESSQQFFKKLGSVNTATPTSIVVGNAPDALWDVGRNILRKNLVQVRQRIEGSPEQSYDHAILELNAGAGLKSTELRLAYSIVLLLKDTPSFLESAAQEFIAGQPISLLFFQISRDFGLYDKARPETLSLTGGLAVYPATYVGNVPTIVMEEHMSFARTNPADDSMHLSRVLRVKYDPHTSDYGNTPFDGGMIHKKSSGGNPDEDQTAANEASRGSAWIHGQLYDSFVSVAQTPQ